MEKYIPEIKQIVGEYRAISKELDTLSERINALELARKQTILKLEKNRSDERVLIDKIEKETGEPVDFRKIIETINATV